MASNGNNPAKNSLGVPEEEGKATGSKRKMTAAIIEDQQQEQEVYEFLEEDDDFEEFELGADYDEFLTAGQVDAEMNGGQGTDADRKIWQQDWDDEEDEEDFGAKLRQQLGM